jgi:hypothetical protein
MKDNKFYVYGHFTDENSEIPFYIGKGSGDRYKNHSNRNNEWKSFVKTNGVIPKILYTDLTEQGAFNKERELIELYGRQDTNTGTLLNKSSGGEGGTYNNYVPDWLVNHIKITMFKVALLDYNFLRNKI